MEKFKEKRIVKILNIITGVLMLSWLVGLLLVLVSDKFLITFVLLPCILPFAITASVLSQKNKYTKEFLAHMREKLSKIRTLEELLEIKKEFEDLAIKDGVYYLSFPGDLKNIHQEIIYKIDILEKQKNIK